MPNPRLSDAKRKRIEALLRNTDMKYRSIARAVGVSEVTVANIAATIWHGGKRKKQQQETRQKVHGEIQNGGSYREVAQRLGIPETTVKDHASQPLVQTDDDELSLPEPYLRDSSDYRVDTPGRWLVLSDIHLPCHDRKAIELAVSRARADGVAGVVVNGDLLDSHEISDHDKDPSAPRYVREVEMGVQFFRWLRERFPMASSPRLTPTGTGADRFTAGWCSPTAWCSRWSTGTSRSRWTTRTATG